MPEQSAAGLNVFPSLIDAHVRFGFGEKITKYTTETIYAAQSGIATILLPLATGRAPAQAGVSPLRYGGSARSARCSGANSPGGNFPIAPYEGLG